MPISLFNIDLCLMRWARYSPRGERNTCICVFKEHILSDLLSEKVASGKTFLLRIIGTAHEFDLLPCTLMFLRYVSFSDNTYLVPSA